MCVFRGGGCLGSLQEWWMSRKSSGVVDVKEVFRCGGCIGSLQVWWMSRTSSGVVDV